MTHVNHFLQLFKLSLSTLTIQLLLLASHKGSHKCFMCRVQILDYIPTCMLCIDQHYGSKLMDGNSIYTYIYRL